MSHPDDDFLAHLKAAGARWEAGEGDTGEGGSPPLDFGDWRREYAALTSGAGVADFSRRTQIELTGSERTAYLQRLCTNDLRKRSPGEGCEAFLTNVQGKILAHVFVFCGNDNLVLETVPGQEAKLLQHLDRYLIREQVVLAGRSQEWAELLLSGPESEALLGRLGFSVPAGRLGHCQASMPLRIELRRVDLAGPTGFLVRCARAELSAAWSILVGADAVPCGQTAVEAARIEAGTPYYGQDMTEDNLPQELARNELAISFTKGCYLGQETVARIDALGRVNKTLCQVQFEPASPEAASVPEVGTELSAGGKDGKVVGHATSVTMSPKLGAPLALAYVRRESNSPGTRLESRYGPALVVGLPHEKLDPQV